MIKLKTLSLGWIILMTLMSFNTSAQQYQIRGTVTDANNRETLPGVPISIKGMESKGVSTDENGKYKLSLPKGDYTLIVKYMGYQDKELTVSLSKNVTKDITLEQSSVGLDEIVVSAQQSDANVTTAQTGADKISLQEIALLPVLMGERDIVKAFQLLPGIKSTGDGNSGLFVRGGSADQNSILLDNMPLYNASHLMGFFSTFNSDVVKDATLYKGAMPAQYGERLAAALDVQTREGNDQNYEVSGGIGIIASRLTLEGPIKKGKSSFLLSGRRTYADMIAKLSGAEDAKNSTLYFYDLNLRMDYKLSDKDKLTVSGYLGQDKLGLDKIVSTDWGNTSASIRWNRLFNDKFSMNTSAIFNKYAYKVDLEMNIDLRISSDIYDYIFKQDFMYANSDNSIWRFGYSSTYHDIAPGKYRFDEGKGDKQPLQHRYSWENGAFVSNQLKLSDKLEVIYGVRLSAFSVLGKGNFYQLDANHNITDTVHYKSGEFVKTYFNVEPRASMVYKLSDISSIKAAYGRTTQNMHLISNSSMMGPMDRWASSSQYIKPQISDQITLGYFRNFNNNKYEFSVEGYYKDLKNQIDFKDNADMYGKDAMETELRFGKGRAYGVEFLLRKKTGKLTGWIGYTLSKSEKKIDEVNNNEWYDATQDRTHDISVVGIYQLNHKWSFSAAFVYYTGNAITYPSGKYMIDGLEIPYYTERNGYRAPDYHRLDLGATLVLRNRKNYYSDLSFGLYNAYGRENPYSIDFRADKNDPSKATAYQYSLFRFVPSVTWNFKFK